MDGSGTTWVDVAQVVAAAAGIAIAGLVALMPYARRPKLSLVEDPERIQSRVERTDLGGLPHIRLLVANAKRRRAAQGARVLVEWYMRRDGSGRESLAYPTLSWPSVGGEAEAGSVVVFAGGQRPIALGRFIRVCLNQHGRIARPDHYRQDFAPVPRGFPIFRTPRTQSAGTCSSPTWT
jgi:hypothetical protein